MCGDIRCYGNILRTNFAQTFYGDILRRQKLYGDNLSRNFSEISVIIYRDMSRKTLSRYLMKKLHGDISRRCDKEKWYGKMVRRHLTKTITRHFMEKKYKDVAEILCSDILRRKCIEAWHGTKTCCEETWRRYLTEKFGSGIYKNFYARILPWYFVEKFYGDILRRNFTDKIYGHMLRRNYTAIYYGNILRKQFTDTFYGEMLRRYFTETFDGNS